MSKQTEDIDIGLGVWQGYGLFLLLFNLYSKTILSEALHSETAGIMINGTPINNIRYPDDTVLLAENIENLKKYAKYLQNLRFTHEPL